MTDDLVKRVRQLGDRTGLMYVDYDTTIEAADRIEKLEAALTHIWAWHPINVSRPHETIDAIRDFAFSVIKGEER